MAKWTCSKVLLTSVRQVSCHGKARLAPGAGLAARRRLEACPELILGASPEAVAAPRGPFRRQKWAPGACPPANVDARRPVWKLSWAPGGLPRGRLGRQEAHTVVLLTVQAKATFLHDSSRENICFAQAAAGRRRRQVGATAGRHVGRWARRQVGTSTSEHVGKWTRRQVGTSTGGHAGRCSCAQKPLSRQA